MENSSKNLGELEMDYLGTLSNLEPSERSVAQQEVRRFVRWFGTDRYLRELRPSDIESFSEEVAKTAVGASNKLQPVKAFLTYAKKHGYISENLATHVRIRRSGTRRDSKGPAVREQATVPITREGLAKLQSEHAALIAQRPIIADELRRAMADKDFRENAPLDAARDRQAQIEGRIREIEVALHSSVVVDADHESKKVAIGKTVYLRDLTEDEEVRFVLVSPNEVDIRQGRISTASPTGRALLDRVVGEEIEVNAPMGPVHYRIERVE
jgi:transcription elongation factor GreA